MLVKYNDSGAKWQIFLRILKWCDQEYPEKKNGYAVIKRSRFFEIWIIYRTALNILLEPVLVYALM